jgi:hypothetical protein
VAPEPEEAEEEEEKKKKKKKKKKNWRKWRDNQQIHGRWRRRVHRAANGSEKSGTGE